MSVVCIKNTLLHLCDGSNLFMMSRVRYGHQKEGNQPHAVMFSAIIILFNTARVCGEKIDEYSGGDNSA